MHGRLTGGFWFMTLPLHVWSMDISYSYFTVLPSTYFNTSHTIPKSKNKNSVNAGFYLGRAFWVKTVSRKCILGRGSGSFSLRKYYCVSIQAHLSVSVYYFDREAWLLERASPLPPTSKQIEHCLVYKSLVYPSKGRAWCNAIINWKMDSLYFVWARNMHQSTATMHQLASDYSENYQWYQHSQTTFFNVITTILDFSSGR